MDNKPTTIANDSAHQVSNGFSKSLEIKNVVSESIINNNKSRWHSSIVNNSIVSLTNANNKLQTQLYNLTKNFEELKHNYDIEVTSKKFRKDLKELYKEQIITPSNEIFKTSQNKNENNNTKNASIVFNRKTNNLLKACFNNINKINDDKCSLILQLPGDNRDITTTIYDQQDIFFKRIDDNLQEILKVEDYLNKLLEKLPDWDPKNKKVREDIMLLIDNDCTKIKNKLKKYEKLQYKMNISNNLVNINKYVYEIKAEIEQIKEKVDINIYKDKNEELYNALEDFSKNYNNLLDNHEFFKDLKNEIQYDNKLEEFMTKKDINKKSPSKLKKSK